MPQPVQTDPAAALRAARALIADPEHWTRSAPARRWKPPHGHAQGDWVPSAATEQSARRFCATGALSAVSGKRSGAPGIGFLDAASHRLFETSIGRANDDARLTTHADVLRAFDLAITLAESEAAGRRRATA
jgi:hypothetical protein